MKFWKLGLVVLLAVVVAACGHDHNGNDHSHSNEDDHDEHGHSHEGIRHAMGQVDLGDGYRLEVTHIGDVEAGKEAMFEVVVKKDGNTIKDANVTCQVIREDGSDVTVSASADWVEAEGLYDGHIKMPAALPEDAHLKVRVRHNDGFDKEHRFLLKGHDHE